MKCTHEGLFLATGLFAPAGCSEMVFMDRVIGERQRWQCVACGDSHTEKQYFFDPAWLWLIALGRALASVC